MHQNHLLKELVEYMYPYIDEANASNGKLSLCARMLHVPKATQNRIRLSKKESALVRFLLEHPNQLLTQQHLQTLLGLESRNALHQTILRVRRKVGAHMCIRNAQGLGYIYTE